MEGKYVFISYSSKDFEQATWVKNTLESNGIQCWMDKKSIHGGQNFSKEIPDAIKGCSAFVLILTGNSQESHWVQEEILEARDSKKRILPFVLDSAPLNGSIPFGFRSIQMYNATENPEKEIENLIRDIREEFNAPAAKIKIQKKAPKSKQQDKTLKGKIKRILIVIGILSVLSYVLAFMIGFFGNSSSAEDEPGISESNETSTYSDQNHPSDNFYDFTQATNDSALSIHQYLSKDNFFFFLDGVQFRLPCSYSELKNNGWELYSDDYSEDSFIDEFTVVKMYKNGYIIDVELYNVCGDPIELRYHTVGGISVDQYYGTDFMAPYGIKLGSTRDDIINTYGKPDYTDTYDEYINYSYTIDNERSYASIFCDSLTHKCFSIKLRNIVY